MSSGSQQREHYGSSCSRQALSVGELCPLAPNNVNTMAVAALASQPALSFDTVKCRLVADGRLNEHVISIDVEGVDGFNVSTVRRNPAACGAVTGQLTYASFLASLWKTIETIKAGNCKEIFLFC